MIKLIIRSCRGKQSINLHITRCYGKHLNPDLKKRTFWHVPPNEDSNQPAHPRSPSRVFVIMKKLCILGYPKYAQRRFWSACANAQSDLNLRWALISEGTFSDVATQSLYGHCLSRSCSVGMPHTIRIVKLRRTMPVFDSRLVDLQTQMSWASCWPANANGLSVEQKLMCGWMDGWMDGWLNDWTPERLS